MRAWPDRRRARAAMSLACGLAIALLLPPPARAQTPPTSTDAMTKTRLMDILTAPPAPSKTVEGWLPIAMDEARGAAGRAALAARSVGDLPTMRQAAADVLHLIDPALAPSTEGRGVGVKPAVVQVITHFQAIVAADTRSDVRRVVPPALTAAQNVLRWCDEVVSIAQRLRDATEEQAAATLASRLAGLTTQLTTGRDGTGDGKVSLTDARDPGGLHAVQFAVSRLLMSRETVARVAQKGSAR